MLVCEFMRLLGRHANKFDDATFYKVERCDPYIISILVGHVSNFIFTVECLIKVMMRVCDLDVWDIVVEWMRKLTIRRCRIHSERRTH